MARKTQGERRGHDRGAADAGCPAGRAHPSRNRGESA
jgi:hypothetical protein